MMNTKFLKKIIFIGAALSIVLLLSACSGVIGGQTSLRISLDNTGVPVAKHVSTDSTDAYIVVVKDDKVFSYNNFEDDVFSDFIEMGQTFTISSLPPDDYIIGVVLFDESTPGDQDPVGLGILKKRIKPGFNVATMVIGPCPIDFSVNGLDVENPFIPKDFSVRFDTNTIIFSGVRKGSGQSDEIVFVPNFGDELITGNGASLIGAGFLGGNGNPGTPYLVPSTASGIQFSMTSTAPGSPFPLTIRLE